MDLGETRGLWSFEYVVGPKTIKSTPLVSRCTAGSQRFFVAGGRGSDFSLFEQMRMWSYRRAMRSGRIRLRRGADPVAGIL